MQHARFFNRYEWRRLGCERSPHCCNLVTMRVPEALSPQPCRIALVQVIFPKTEGGRLINPVYVQRLRQLVIAVAIVVVSALAVGGTSAWLVIAEELPLYVFLFPVVVSAISCFVFRAAQSLWRDTPRADSNVLIAKLSG